MYTQMVAHTKWSKANLKERATKIPPYVRRRTKKRIFQWFKNNERAAREERLCRVAMVLWEEHLLKRIVRYWKICLLWQVQLLHNGYYGVMAVFLNDFA